jgi:carbon-monoxide dehydrogenase large subunit
VSAPYVGQAVPRVEDGPLLVGGGCFADDLHRDGELSARIVRSDAAHGRIRSVDGTAALRCPGVVAVLTGRDIPDLRIPVRMMPSDEAVPVTQPPLARDFVRYVGEPVAVVVAEGPYLAEDAAEAVEVDIEELEALVDPMAARAPGAPVLHADCPTGNVVNTLRAKNGRPVDELLAAADVVVRDRLRVQRHAAIPLETRGLLAEVDPGTGRLTVWGPTKVKHFNRTILATFLGRPEADIRFVEPDVGGGFGARGEFYPEDFLIPWLAIELGRPVKWIEDRHEHFVAINHSRQLVCDFELGASADGRLLGFRASCSLDHGAYARTHGTMLMPWVVLHHLAGPYVWEGFEIETESVLTNKTPSGTYRGPGQFEAAYLRERMIDRAAVELSIDPAELRLRNLVPLDAMPYRVELAPDATPAVYDSGDFPQAMHTLLDGESYGAARDDARRRRAAGELAGVGLCAFVEEAAFGRYEFARVVPDGDRFVAYVGVASLGQGVRTALAQILADELRVPIELVEISHHDTDLVPEGFGAYASRATVLGGGAVVGAVADLREKAIAAAAERLEIDTSDLELAPGGIVSPRGNPGRGIALADLGCDGHCRFEKEVPSFDMGAAMALVTVDAETGGVEVRRIAVCQDVGRIVNPAIVDGQLVGAAAQGVGGALLEELAYDSAGQPLATSFMDYLMPTASDVPHIESYALELPHHDPATENPLGVKGCGEGGVIGAGAAVANAVADALGPAGARATDLPLSPAVVIDLLQHMTSEREAV